MKLAIFESTQFSIDDWLKREGLTRNSKSMQTFYCAGNNEITSLVGSPKRVGGNFECSDNKLTSLVGGPAFVGGDYWVHRNKLTSLEGASPYIGKSFLCMYNNLKDLKNVHKHLPDVKLVNFRENPIKSHVLGLLKIKRLHTARLSNANVEQIINRHLMSDRNIMACQEELIDAGFEEFAQL